MQNQNVAGKEMSIEEKLRLLFDLQAVASEMDKLKILRGELPLEVQDLEDEVAGLKTRINNYQDEIKNLETAVASRKAAIVESKGLIAKYTEQQNNVRNNREFDSLSKEIEFQNLEIELSEKRIKEFTAELEKKNTAIGSSKEQLKEREDDLDRKQTELEEITAETKIETERLNEKASKIEVLIEDRLLAAFRRIRKNARNGLAVVSVERDACGGCFNKIPPQRQLDIASHKKIIVCEYCGRILVDKDIHNDGTIEE
ncbi:MAG TPA: C4-type zinc ribbon domain-containing protein [Prolixibacteraceae bacterium]|nr:C4-type zinc ribbon domain-containing protein [Prolixibacteraceae bacterium]HQN92947.1 C4-type zinc ribbon domain-containing protein [Prolixibacteraceae bacterium]HUM88283.1 C4-type zinc ribbon domain-containing protein [Prolixibacteraceae bacterium]